MPYWTSKAIYIVAHNRSILHAELIFYLINILRSHISHINIVYQIRSLVMDDIYYHGIK